MSTISVCMIVKNEEENLPRCLDSLRGLWDELIIVDTGSADKTKEIAASYGAKLYDFPWINDFSAARNFAFSKASCDYIYSADADEALDEDNRNKFFALKRSMDDGVDIVQMYYKGQLRQSTVYNFDRELRPKLFKRQRTFTWIDPIHETIRTLPVVYDSDIEIDHKPHENHAARDLEIFEKNIEARIPLSKRLIEMYARELLSGGNADNYKRAIEYFMSIVDDIGSDEDAIKRSCVVLANAGLVLSDMNLYIKYSLKGMALDASSELCCVNGLYFMDVMHDNNEATIWFYNAVYECEPILSKEFGIITPLERLVKLCKDAGLKDMADNYEAELDKVRLSEDLYN